MFNTTTTAETKAASFAQVGARELKRLNEQLRDLVIGHQVNGGRDMTGREIQRAYEARYSKRIESGTVSGAINRLVATIGHPKTMVCLPTKYPTIRAKAAPHAKTLSP